MKRSTIAAAFLLLLSKPAWGAGISLYETGAPDLGTASAGRAAMAADASTVATNPAGMTLLDRTQLMITSGAMLPAINFDRGPKTDVPGGGGGGGNAGGFFPIGGVFYAQKISDRLWLGAALYVQDQQYSPQIW
jgi:long-chain fatty acid transport protein